jgi:hypothetical protein
VGFSSDKRRFRHRADHHVRRGQGLVQPLRTPISREGHDRAAEGRQQFRQAPVDRAEPEKDDLGAGQVLELGPQRIADPLPRGL